MSHYQGGPEAVLVDRALYIMAADLTPGKHIRPAKIREIFLDVRDAKKDLVIYSVDIITNLLIIYLYLDDLAWVGEYICIARRRSPCISKSSLPASSCSG